MNKDCHYRSSWTDSGDRGADMADHERAFHPDHEHAWAPSAYEWEQAGTKFRVSDPDNYPRTKVAIRTEADVPTRCTECGIEPKNDQQGKCA